jgi:hypothetical protein
VPREFPRQGTFPGAGHASQADDESARVQKFSRVR